MRILGNNLSNKKKYDITAHGRDTPLLQDFWNDPSSLRILGPQITVLGWLSKNSAKIDMLSINVIVSGFKITMNSPEETAKTLRRQSGGYFKGKSVMGPSKKKGKTSWHLKIF